MFIKLCQQLTKAVVKPKNIIWMAIMKTQLILINLYNCLTNGLLTVKYLITKFNSPYISHVLLMVIINCYPGALLN